MKYKIGDVKEILQNKDFEVFCHGVNLEGAFAAGIAGLVRSIYPECYNTYMTAVNSGEYKGGQMVPYEVKGNQCFDSFEEHFKYFESTHKIILNAFTQIHPGPDGSYDLIDKVFKTIARVYDCKISFPLIGCGIAGLDWNIVKHIIDHRLEGKDYECIVRMEDIEKYGLLND